MVMARRTELVRKRDRIHFEPVKKNSLFHRTTIWKILLRRKNGVP